MPLRHNQLENASARPINCPPLSSAGLPGPVELGYPFATLLSWNEIMWSLPLPAPLDHTLFLGGWETMSSEEYQLEKCMDGSDSLQVTPRCRTVCMWDCPSVVPLIAGPFTKSSQSPECEPVPPQCGHSLCTYLGTVPSWLVRDGPDRDHQAIRNCLYRAEHSAD